MEPSWLAVRTALNSMVNQLVCTAGLASLCAVLAFAQAKAFHSRFRHRKRALDLTELVRHVRVKALCWHGMLVAYLPKVLPHCHMQGASQARWAEVLRIFLGLLRRCEVQA